MRVQRGGRELVEQIAGEWRRLCDESGDEEVFYRPEWAHAYLQAFEPKAEVIIISAWAGERLRGILPLVRRRDRNFRFARLSSSRFRPTFILCAPASPFVPEKKAQPCSMHSGRR